MHFLRCNKLTTVCTMETALYMQIYEIDVIVRRSIFTKCIYKYQVASGTRLIINDRLICNPSRYGINNLRFDFTFLRIKYANYNNLCIIRIGERPEWWIKYYKLTNFSLDGCPMKRINVGYI